jgi:hypothetical protein
MLLQTHNLKRICATLFVFVLAGSIANRIQAKDL